MRLRRMLAIWAAKITEKMGRKNRFKDMPNYTERTGRTGKEGYLYRLRHQWKDDHQQYALRSHRS